MNAYEIMGSRIRMARKIAKMSVEELAEKLDGMISLEELRNYEAYMDIPDGKTLSAIADILGFNIDFFSNEMPGEIPFTLNVCGSIDDMRLESLYCFVLDRYECYDTIEEELEEEFVGKTLPLTTPLLDFLGRSEYSEEDVREYLKKADVLFEELVMFALEREERTITISKCAALLNIPVLELRERFNNYVRSKRNKK